MEQLGLPGDTMRRRVEETLDLLGIAALRHRDLRRLSGGEQQRVALGSVLTMHPRVLVLDEPTSALDPTAAEDVLATLTRLVHDLDVSVVLAEHRLERVVPFADTLVALAGDGTLRSGAPVDLLQDSPVAPPLVELGRSAGWQPLPLTVRDARRRAVDLRDRLGPPPEDAPPGVATGGLEATGVTVLHGQTLAVRGVTLALRPGSVTALMGRNGSGKSSLLWALQGSGRRLTGRVAVAGQDPAGLEDDVRRRTVGMVPQNAADLLYLETVADELRARPPPPRPPRRAPSSTPWSRASPTTPTRGTCPRANDSPSRSRWCWPPPRRSCCSTSRRAASTTPRSGRWPRPCADWPADGHAVLVATHDVEFVAQAAGVVVVLADGEVVSSGPVRRVVAESPAFAPQVTKVLGAPWLRVDEVVARL